MRRVLLAFVLLLLISAPAAQAARPAVAFTRPTVTRSAKGKKITVLPRGRPLQFDVGYIVRNVPLTWKAARAQVFVTIWRGTNTLRLRTTRARTSTGTWRWVLKGRAVQIPATFPRGRYRLRVRVDITHGKLRVARAMHTGRAAVT